jgi:hypothetical protein
MQLGVINKARKYLLVSKINDISTELQKIKTD